MSDKARQLREGILYEIAFIESALDDPEHISLDGYHDRLLEKSLQISSELKKLIDSADNGKMLKDGINTVIVGKPNAGKSSLLNLLVGEDKAIVTSIAGTTRDVLEESIRLNGVGLNIIDTAGIRATEDEVEKIGVDKARKYAGNADLIIYVVDASRELDENDNEIMKLIRDKKVIVLLNKTDLEQVVREEDVIRKMTCMSEKSNSLEKNDLKQNMTVMSQKNSNLDKNQFERKMTDMSQKGAVKMIRTSTKENTGMDVFEQTIKDMFFGGEIAVNDELYITNQRHKEALTEAYESMQMVLQSLEDDMPEDFYSIDLMSAYASLGKIIGEEVGDDLVNEIFSKFCMGK